MTMSRQQVPLGFSSTTVPSGSRVAYLCSGEPQSYGLLVAFLAAGLARGEKCIAAVPECPVRFWEQEFSGRGIDVRDLRPGQFHTLAGDHLTHVVEGRWECVRALADEYEGSQTRVCTNLNPFAPDVHSVASLAALYAISPRKKSRPAGTVLCAIAAEDIHPNALQDCLDLHDFATDGSGISAVIRKPARMPHSPADAGASVERSSMLRFVSDTPVLRTPDEFEIYTSAHTGRLVNLLIELGHRRMVLDLGGTSFIDAAGVRVLLIAYSRMRELEGSLVILDPRAPRRRIYRLIGLPSLIPIAQTFPDAIDLVTREHAPTEAPLPDSPRELRACG